MSAEHPVFTRAWRNRHAEGGDAALKEAEEILGEPGDHNIDNMRMVQAWIEVAHAHYEAAKLERPTSASGEPT
jgi:hypothetical protein